MYTINTLKHRCILLLTIILAAIPAAIAKGLSNQPVESGKILKPIYKASPPSKSSEEGKHLFQSNGCTACHSIQTKGGCLGPPLDDIGAYRSKKFIRSRITDNEAAIEEFEKLYGEAELMPHPRIPASDASHITDYLLTLKPPTAGFYINSHSAKDSKTNKLSNITQNQLALLANPSSIAAGKKLFYEHGCTACHSVDNIGGHFAPALDGIAKRRSKEYVYQRINNAEFLAQNYPDEYQDKGNIMPPSNLTDKEISAITNFLMTLR